MFSCPFFYRSDQGAPKRIATVLLSPSPASLPLFIPPSLFFLYRSISLIDLPSLILISIHPRPRSCLAPFQSPYAPDSSSPHFFSPSRLCFVPQPYDFTTLVLTYVVLSSRPRSVPCLATLRYLNALRSVSFGARFSFAPFSFPLSFPF